MWDLPGPGLEPVSPALAGGFLTTVPPGKPWTFIYCLLSIFSYPLVQRLFQPPPDEIFKTWTLCFLKRFLWLPLTYTTNGTLVRAMSMAPVKGPLSLAASPLLHHVLCACLPQMRYRSPVHTRLSLSPGLCACWSLALNSDSASVTSSEKPS